MQEVYVPIFQSNNLIFSLLMQAFLCQSFQFEAEEKTRQLKRLTGGLYCQGDACSARGGVKMKQEKPLDASVYQLRLSETLLDSLRFHFFPRRSRRDLGSLPGVYRRKILSARVDACTLFVSL